ncbi:MAG: FHA domain-containing protein [Actinobacteria bacterium]|nr:FHA domain-containing protein [Actinomycetota bacterium]
MTGDGATLVVMFGPRSWPIEPGETFSFGRSERCTVVLSRDDRSLSRTAGSLRWHDGFWWARNDSQAGLLYVTGDRGFRADLAPGMRIPLQQWHAKLRLTGGRGSYTLLVRLPGLDDEPTGPLAAAPVGPAAQALADAQATAGLRYRPRLSDSDRLILAARFEKYLAWRYPGVAEPCTAREAAERIGWGTHAVVKRCENIRERYARMGVPGLRGPRALEELATLLISSGELTAEDLARLPATAQVPS